MSLEFRRPSDSLIICPGTLWLCGERFPAVPLVEDRRLHRQPKPHLEQFENVLGVPGGNAVVLVLLVAGSVAEKIKETIILIMAADPEPAVHACLNAKG